MSESIQSCTAGCVTMPDHVVRTAFIHHAAELYGRPLAATAGDLETADDTAALLLAFPWLDDAELLEALWALGQYRSAAEPAF